MKLDRVRLSHTLCVAISLAYFSLAGWMHVWVLEAGVLQPGEPSSSHHQVCTWIGTSGEASLASVAPPAVPQRTISLGEAVLFPLPLLPADIASIQVRAPPQSLLSV